MLDGLAYVPLDALHSILPRCEWTTTIRSCGITRRTREYMHCESFPPEWET